MFTKSKAFKSLGSSTTALATAGILFTATLGGCSGTGAHQVATGGPETITTVDQIDDQDWANAATTLTNEMLSQDGLFPAKADGTKQVLVVYRVNNTTANIVDTDLLTKTITVTLNRSGKVLTRTRDAQASQDAAVSDFERNTTTVPDLRLSGKLIETQASAGDVRQATFYFQLSLTDKNGNDIYEGQKKITKIGTRNSVGM